MLAGGAFPVERIEESLSLFGSREVEAVSV
jgi:hypothetical protein